MSSVDCSSTTNENKSDGETTDDYNIPDILNSSVPIAVVCVQLWFKSKGSDNSYRLRRKDSDLFIVPNTRKELQTLINDKQHFTLTVSTKHNTIDLF